MYNDARHWRKTFQTYLDAFVSFLGSILPKYDQRFIFMLFSVNLVYQHGNMVILPTYNFFTIYDVTFAKMMRLKWFFQVLSKLPFPHTSGFRSLILTATSRFMSKQPSTRFNEHGEYIHFKPRMSLNSRGRQFKFFRTCRFGFWTLIAQN